MAEPATNTFTPAGSFGGRSSCDGLRSQLTGIRPIAIGLFTVTLLACTLLACGTAQAQIMVEGPRDAVRIDVTDAPLRDVLGALQTKFNLRFRGNATLDRLTTARIRGPLRHVVARLLDGYDFAMTMTPDGLDVLILQQSAAAGIAVIQRTPARLPLPAAPVMTAQEANRYERSRSR